MTDDEDNMIPFEKKERTSFKEKKAKSIQKGIFILPSVVTAAGLFLGFFAIIYTLRSVLLGREEFELAVYSIILAGIVDSFDGRLARAMKAESEFGQQFDRGHPGSAAIKNIVHVRRVRRVPSVESQRS